MWWGFWAIFRHMQRDLLLQGIWNPRLIQHGEVTTCNTSTPLTWRLYEVSFPLQFNPALVLVLGRKAGFGRKKPLWLCIRRSPPIWSRQDSQLLSHVKAPEPPDPERLTLPVATWCQHLQIKAQICSEMPEYSGGFLSSCLLWMMLRETNCEGKKQQGKKEQCQGREVASAGLTLWQRKHIFIGQPRLDISVMLRSRLLRYHQNRWSRFALLLADPNKHD